MFYYDTDKKGMMPVADSRGDTKIALAALYDVRSALGLSDKAYLDLLDLEQEMFILRLEAVLITLQRSEEK